MPLFRQFLWACLIDLRYGLERYGYLLAGI
jgi:hypothetical protein